MHIRIINVWLSGEMGGWNSESADSAAWSHQAADGAVTRDGAMESKRR